MKVARKFTPEEVGLIHRTMMPGASKDDVAIFVATCERTGLDPFAKQIMPTSRNVNKNGAWVTIWGNLTTIDGLRKIAVDTGDYEGQEGPWWCGQDGVWKDLWTDSKNPCYAAKVVVHRKGFRTGLPGIAKYDAYVQKKKDGQPNQVWQTLGDHMTAKCAEALGLRRAFPNEMAGLYTEDEEGAAEIIHAVVDAPDAAQVEWTDDERQEAKMLVADLAEALLEAGMDESEMREKVAKPTSTIGDPELSLHVWSNRLLGYRERLMAKLKTAQVDPGTLDALTAHDA